jgi:nuclear pore complex protein Nup214
MCVIILSVSLKNMQCLFAYFVHRNILMVASANSVEVGVMGLQEDQISWEQWTQDDAARAELPLSVDKEETYPVGFVLDTSTQHELPWGQLVIELHLAESFLRI